MAFVRTFVRHRFLFSLRKLFAGRIGGGRRNVGIAGALDFIAHFVGGLLEFLDSLSKTFGEFGQFFCAKKKEDDRKDENNLSSAKIK